MVDYSNIDWSLSNHSIAQILGITRGSVRKKREKLGLPPSIHKSSGNPNPYKGPKRSITTDIDFEFAWKKKGKNGKGGGKAWSRAVKNAKGVVCQICGYNKNSIINDCHHITPISKGGKNTIRNGIVLCARCHTEVHAGILKISDHIDIENLK